MKIFKLSRAEMQKIYARPSIFIMTFLFILIIAGSALIYNVPDRSTGIVTIPGTTVNDVYTHYTNQANAESKFTYDSQLDQINDTIDAYTVNYTPIQNLLDAYNNIEDAYTSYSLSVNTNSPISQINANKLSLKTAITNFKDLYNSIFNEPYTRILVSEDTHISLLQFLDTCDSTIIETNEADNVVILNNLNSLDFLNIIEGYVNEIKPFIVSNSTINTLENEYLVNLESRLASINTEIIDYNTNNSTSDQPSNLSYIKKLISKYKLTVKQYEQIAISSMHLDAFSGYDNSQVNRFIGFEDIHFYELEENLVKDIFLFSNNDFKFNYANPFNIVSPSNESINAFDFAHFTLELFTFVIIVYVVILGAGMIAGEEANGTMKLLAIRPYKRYKIFLGKTIAALRVGLIFLIIGAMASILTGTFLFTASSLPVLSVFNAKYVLTLSPYVMFGIYLLTLFVQIMFYVVIAVSISSIFKSYTGAVTIAILIYFASTILSFITGASWLKFIPLTNTNLFNYFGTAFINNNGAAGLEALVSPPILKGTDFMFSTGILGATMIIFLAVSIMLFSKRDLK